MILTGERKENLNDDFENKKDFEEDLKKIRQLKCSSYYFEHFANMSFFIRLREKIKSTIKTKEDEIFYPKKLRPDLSMVIKTMIERYSDSELINVENTDFYLLKKVGESDILFDLVTSLTNNLTLEKFIELENRYSLIYFFTEFESYLFKCFKYILTQRPDIIDDTKVSLKEIKEANGEIKKIINSKAEIEALSKFDLELFIDEIIEKKIHNKFYSNYMEIFNYAEKVLGITLSIPKEAIVFLNFFKQVRNLYTHGDGTINQIFLKRIKLMNKRVKKYKLGEKYRLTDEFIKDLELIIRVFMIHFDSKIIKLYPELTYK